MHFDFTGTEILHVESRHFFSYLPMLHFAFSFPIFGDVHPPTSAILSLLSGFWVMLFWQDFVAMFLL